MITKRLFLASSSELKEDRREFEILVGRKNSDWVARGVYLDLLVWENFLDAVAQHRLQDEYNKTIRDCDIFVMLFWTKVGKYTEEEFETAFGQFKASNKPFIFTYFKDAEINVSRANEKDLTTLWAFQHKLNSLGHFSTVYKNTDDLKFQFSQQLDKLAAKGFIEFTPEKGRPLALGKEYSPVLGRSSENIESELKFTPQGNSQLKYIANDDFDDLPRKIGLMLKSSGYVVSNSLDEINFRTQVDWYYDDRNNALQFNGYSLRRRKIGEGKTIKITLKSLSDRSGNEFLTRDEYEITINEEDLGKLTSSPSDFIYRLTNGIVDHKIGALRHKFTVHNKRGAIVVNDSQDSYEIAFDRYYYHDPETGFYSEYFFEIEVEALGAQRNSEEAVNIVKVIQNVLNLTSNKTSKFQRGMSWLTDPRQQGINVVGYAFRLAKADIEVGYLQQQLFQILSKLVKDNIKSLSLPTPVFILSDGDCISCYWNSEDVPIGTAADFQKDLRKRILRYQAGSPLSEKLRYASTICKCVVYKYTDIVGGVSYCGSDLVNAWGNLRELPDGTDRQE
jgi:hypothetical protein